MNPDPPENVHPTLPIGASGALAPERVVLERYRLKRLIGRGGFGTVWRAWDEQLQMDVAIKFLYSQILVDTESIEDLKRETRYSLRLTHPNVVRIHGFLQAPDLAGICMEYVDGGTLSERKTARPSRCFDVHEIAKWALQLCEALDYAHNKVHLVHRDLKPGNLMVDAAGDLKIADFGISRSLSDTRTRLTVDRGTSGTPAYMSPQQMMGETAHASDDIYALGATLYDLLAGKAPFYSGDIFHQIRTVTPPSIAARRKELSLSGGPIPEAWEETIAACLSKDAAKRPGSAMEVAERLGLLTLSRRGRAPGPRAMRRPLWIGATAAVAIVGAGLAWYLLSGKRSESPPGAGSDGARTAEGVGGAGTATDAGSVPSAEEIFDGPPATGGDAGARAGAGTDGSPSDAEARRGTEARNVAGADPAAGAVSRGGAAELPSPAVPPPPLPRGTGAAGGNPPGAPTGSAGGTSSATAGSSPGPSAGGTGGPAAGSPAGTGAGASPDPATGATSEGVLRGAADTPRVRPPASAQPDREPSPPKPPAEDQVRQTVEVYRRALEALDVNLYATVFESLSRSDREKLAKSFGDLRSQSTDITFTRIEVSGSSARAAFRERRSLSFKAGREMTMEHEVAMDMKRGGDGRWLISRMEYR